MSVNQQIFSESVNDQTPVNSLAYCGIPSINEFLSRGVDHMKDYAADTIFSGVDQMKGFASQAFTASAAGVQETLSFVNSTFLGNSFDQALSATTPLDNPNFGIDATTELSNDSTNKATFTPSAFTAA